MKRINPDRMSRQELDRLYEEAEKVTRENTRPLTATERKELAVAARKGGRPRIGSGAQRINVTVERELLKKADAYAKKHGLTRAAIMAEGLKRIVAA